MNWIDPWGLATLPNDPSGLPPVWKPDPSHKDPNGQRFRDPNGRPLDWHPGKPGEPGWGGKDHWHDPNNSGKQHLRPGTDMPDPAMPISPWSPLRWPGLFPLIPNQNLMDPCLVFPGLPGCKGCS